MVLILTVLIVDDCSRIRKNQEVEKIHACNMVREFCVGFLQASEFFSIAGSGG